MTQMNLVPLISIYNALALIGQGLKLTKIVGYVKMTDHYYEEIPLMRLTTKGRYAVTAMLDLSLNYHVGTITLSDISERQGISLSYLEQLFAKLRKEGLVSSTRGPGGGYRLGREACDISVLEVISAVDEKVDNTACEGKGNCRKGEACLSHKLWHSLSEQIKSYLSAITLGNILEDYNENEPLEGVLNIMVEDND